jgi:hypothetical protein
VGTQLIPLPGGLNISLNYPDNTPVGVVNGLIPTVIQAASRLAGQGILATTAVVEGIAEAKLSIAYYREYTRVMIEDVIPVEAMYAAHQRGRDAINNMHLEPQLRQEALDALARKRRERNSRL